MMIFKALTLTASFAGSIVVAYNAGIASTQSSEAIAVSEDPDPTLAVAHTLLHTKSATAIARQHDEEERRKSFIERKAYEAKKQNTIEQLTAAPPKSKRSMKRACSAAVEEYGSYQERQRSGDDWALATWYKVRGKTLGKLRSRCRQINDKKVASCFSHSLENAPTEFGDIGKDILKTCVNTHNPQAFERLWQNSIG